MPMCRWKKDIKMDTEGTGRGGGVDWIHVAPDRDQWRALVKTVLNFRVT
jgi:hypothetical protein